MTTHMSDLDLSEVRKTWNAGYRVSFETEVTMLNEIERLTTAIEERDEKIAHLENEVSTARTAVRFIYAKESAKNRRLGDALEQIREHERVVNAGSKSWSIANTALQPDKSAIELDPRD